MRIFALICIGAIVSSCASSYKSIKPGALPYPSYNETNGMGYSYQFEVLRNSGNKKYANKEVKKGVKLVAVKIENKTDRTITLREDVKIYIGESVVLPMEPKQVSHQLRQPAPLYLLWGLLWLNITKCENDDCSSTPIPVGLGIGALNVAVASSANKKFLDELYANNILDKKIAPGETAYGLIGISSELTAQLTFKLN